MKKLIFIISIFLYISTFAENPVFVKANQQYNKENYFAAISLYDSIIKNNLESSAIYHNLGNCYYKTQDWANAIWHYEKSLMLKKDKNTLENLELTKLKIKDKIQPIPQLFYKKWWNNLIHLQSTKSWQILSLICIWIILIFYILNKLMKYKNKYILYFLNFLLITLLYINFSSYQLQYNTSQAIIFSSSVNVNSAPTEKSKNLFSLHSGTKVIILDNIEDWIKIKIADGKNGWIKATNCRILK